MLRHKTRGRPREFDVDAALDKAIQIFSERGYHATSMAELSAAMALSTGSVYKAFTDKRAVFQAALERYLLLRAREMQQLLDRTRKPGRERLRAALLFYAGNAHGPEGRRGCLVAGTAVELAGRDDEIAAWVAESFRARKALFHKLLREGQSDGSVSSNIDLEATADLLLCLIQGMRVVGKTRPTHAQMRAVVDAAMKLID